MTQRKTVLCIFGTRPEAIKMVPVIRALQSSNWARCIVVVTAQHRDLLDQMLTRFGIAVDYDLNIMQPKQSRTTLRSACPGRHSHCVWRGAGGFSCPSAFWPH